MSFSRVADEVTLQAAILSEVQLKQERERKVAVDVINEATTLGNIKTWLASIGTEVSQSAAFCFFHHLNPSHTCQNYNEELSKLRVEHDKREQVVTSAATVGQQQLSETDLERFAEERDARRSLLVRAIALRVASEYMLSF